LANSFAELSENRMFFVSFKGKPSGTRVCWVPRRVSIYLVPLEPAVYLLSAARSHVSGLTWRAAIGAQIFSQGRSVRCENERGGTFASQRTGGWEESMDGSPAGSIRGV